MSAFIVNKESIEHIGTLLYSENYFKRKIKECLLIDLDEKDGFNKLCTELYRLNYDAVNHRYREQTELKEEKYYFLTNTNRYQSIKTVQCFIYQCSEGDIPDRKLFKLVEDLLLMLCENLITESIKYKKAKWE